MAIRKVEMDGTTFIDLTNDTAIASDVAQGKTFHLATGEIAVGTNSGVYCIGIDIITPPTKSAYNPGETLDVNGILVQASYSNGATKNITSSCTYEPAVGTEITEDTTVVCSYVENGAVYTDTFDVVYIEFEAVSWANGAAQQLKNMIDAHYAGLINLNDYWSLGDTRTITLPAMSATGVSESHASQSIELVLMDSTCTGFKLTNTNTTPTFIVGMKQCLNEAGYTNSSNTNNGGWSASARRTWCNNVYKTAMDSVMPNIFKQFTWSISEGGYFPSSLIISNDYFALPPEKAIFGSATYSFSNEAALYSQWDWYTTSSNRIKQVNQTDSAWWESSPRTGYTSDFCIVRYNGTAIASSASDRFGISPFGCI